MKQIQGPANKRRTVQMTTCDMLQFDVAKDEY